MHRQLLIFAAALICATPTTALDLPARKPGLWELKLMLEGRKDSHVMQHCIDAATDQLMNQTFAGITKEACSKQDMQTSGNTITIDSVCKVGSQTNVSRAVITGSLDKAYTMRIASTTEGAPAKAQAGAVPNPPALPAGQNNLTIEATWLGPCKAGQKPGDIVLPGGITMNVKNLQGMLPGLMPQR
jgi:hypothetical protein